MMCSEFCFIMAITRMVQVFYNIVQSQKNLTKLQTILKKEMFVKRPQGQLLAKLQLSLL